MIIERFRLDARRALVTGGGQGIGRSVAQALCEAGARVTIADNRADNLADAVTALASMGHTVETIELDVTNSEAVQAAADDYVGRHGGIDILVNNAGIARSETPAETVEDEHWLNVLDVNLNGTFWCARSFGRHMLAARSGAIVNVGSMSGFIVNRPQAQSYYNASKAAVHQLTKSLAAEWADRGVRVNAVAPGTIATELARNAVLTSPEASARILSRTPMKRLGEPSEIADVVAFLLSDAASYVTGEIVTVDGGRMTLNYTVPV